MSLVDDGMYDNPAPFPPNHPMHRYCLEDRWGMRWSLLSPFDPDETSCEVSDEDRERATALLVKWDFSKLALEHPLTREWVLLVLGYYKHHYGNPHLPDPQRWHPLNLCYLPALNELALPDEHAGVHFIRRFYAHYQPTADDFRNAFWSVTRALAIRQHAAV
jgi:hypothetical protein